MAKPCEEGVDTVGEMQVSAGDRRRVHLAKMKTQERYHGMSDGCSAWSEPQAWRQKNNDGRGEGQKQDGGELSHQIYRSENGSSSDLTNGIEPMHCSAERKHGPAAANASRHPPLTESKGI